MWRPMKPETIRRRAEARQAVRTQRREALFCRVADKAADDNLKGESLYAELLADLLRAYPELAQY